MKQAIRLVLTLTVLSFLGLSYQNCTSYSENTLNGSTECSDCGGFLFDPGMDPPVIKNSSIVDFDDEEPAMATVEISGRCFFPEHIEPELRLTIESFGSGALMGLGLLANSNQIMEISEIRCQHGKYYVIFTPVQPLGSSITRDFQLKLRLFHRVDGLLIEDPQFTSVSRVRVLQSLPN
ncbi:MAG: hypothetical protein ACK5RO_06575 [Pseudobdellovibrionaceae bacterium]